MSNISPIGILSFCNDLFTPRPPKPGAEPRYQTILIWDEQAQATEEYKQLRQNVMAAAQEKWGDKAAELFKSGALRSPIRQATEYDQYEGFTAGRMFARFWSHTAPGIIDGNLQDVLDKSYVYAGCLGRCSYRAFPYDNSGNKGVGLGLVNVQITDVTTPRIDGKAKAKDEFAPVAGGTPSPALADDEIPF